MRLFLIWFLLSLIVAIIAHEKGRSAWKFFCLAMLLSPPVGFLAALLSAPSEEIQKARGLKSGLLKKCLFCAGIVKAKDTVCRICNRSLPEIIDVDATVENNS